MPQRQMPQKSSATRRTAILNWVAVASTLIIVVVLLVVSMYFLISQGLLQGQTIVLIIATMVSTVVGLLSALLNFFQWRATEVLSDAPPDTLFAATPPGRKGTEVAAMAMVTSVATVSQSASHHIDWSETSVVEQSYGRDHEPGGRQVNSVQSSLNQQFQRLSPLEQSILYWLAIKGEAVSFNELHTDMLPAPSKRELLVALNSLRQYRMIESSEAARFALPPVILEYVTNRFIQHIVREIAQELYSSQNPGH